MATEHTLLREITGHIARNQLDQAARLCSLLTNQYPQNDAGWCAASVIACKTKDPERGLACADKAVSINAKDSNNWFARANVLVALKQFDSALIDAQKALALNPNEAKFLDNAAGIASQTGHFDLAEKYYTEALTRSPENARLHFNLGTIKRFLGRQGEAETCFDRAIQYDPADFESYHLRSDVVTQTPQSNHVEQLSLLLETPIADWRGEMKLCFALAKELEDLKQFEDSFQYLERGANLRRRHMTYDVTTDERAIDDIIATYSEALFGNIEQGASTESPIFIVGLPRTGTTLVERILSNHTDVESLGELNEFALELTRGVRRHGIPADRHHFIEMSSLMNFDDLGRAYLNSVSSRRGTEPRFIDKLPLNFLYCGLIHKALPRAKIIHVTRRPMDACYAMYKRLFRDAYPMSYDLEDLGRYYLSYRSLMTHWHRLMPGALHSVSYELLVEDLEGETRRLLSFCDLPWQANCIEFHRNTAASTTASASQIRQPIYNSSVDKWKHYAEQLVPLSRLLEEGGVAIDEAPNFEELSRS
jgi:tetratricopeptide (TPR) repeat protein